jgi:protein TonB
MNATYAAPNDAVPRMSHSLSTTAITPIFLESLFAKSSNLGALYNHRTQNIHFLRVLPPKHWHQGNSQSLALTHLPHNVSNAPISKGDFIKVFGGILGFLALMGWGIFAYIAAQTSPNPDTIVEVFFAPPVVEAPISAAGSKVSPNQAPKTFKASQPHPSPVTPSALTPDAASPSPPNPTPTPQNTTAANPNPTHLPATSAPSNTPTQPESATGATSTPGAPSEPQILDRPPKLLAGPVPTYPPSALRRELEGTVVALITTAPDGSVREVEILQSAGRDFDRAVLTAAKQAKFEAPIYRGQAVSARFQRTYAFSLSD